MSSDLAILNAEQFMGAAGLQLTRHASKAKKSHPPHSDDGPRKRTKRSTQVTVVERVDDEGGDENADEKSARVKGRPRLDEGTKDQTAADRRRTQIRLAQRAYRSRKENAIQNLEKEVQSLHATNEEMSNAFMKLQDYAVSHGILEMLPGFARELRSTMEKFLTLARRSSESGSGRDSHAGSPGLELGVSGEDKPPRSQKDKLSSPEATKAVPMPNISSSVWGYTFEPEAEIDPALTMTDRSMPDTHQLTTISQAPVGYEITMPTLNNNNNNNNSFAFDTQGLESFFSQDSSTPPALTTTTPTLTPPSISRYLYPLPLPSTMSFTEATFGRRLQRVALESGYQLITMANPPKARYAKAFGFCLLFEPADKIRARLRRGIERTRHESLNHWASPFWALGGAGQRQPRQSDTNNDNDNDECVGNRGTADVAKHAFGTNFGLGPFDARTADARDTRLDPSMRIVLPGFQGEFFDPDEVEVYLQTRGVRIRPGQDFVTAEVDAAWFEDSEDTARWLGEDLLGAARANEGLLALNASREVLLSAGKRIVTLDVGVLIRELVNRSVCLGRSPGFRPEDVNEAFWAATRSDAIMDF
ncbi:unnamed protein product [Discula destructiva]